MSATTLAIEVGVGQSGPLGLLIVLVLAGVAVFLYRSMNKHIQRIPDSFDDPTPSRDERDEVGPAPDGSGPDGSGAGPRGPGEAPPGSGPTTPHR